DHPQSASLTASLDGLCAGTKLERDRSETAVQSALATDLSSALATVAAWLDTKWQAADSGQLEPEAWEQRFGCLRASCLLLQHLQPPVSPELLRRHLDRALPLLSDPEFRVRVAAGECVGEVCRRDQPTEAAGGGDSGGFFVELLRPLILAGIRDNLERMTAGDARDASPSDSSRPDSPSPMMSAERHDKEAIFHDTAGWKNLETWMRCLLCVVDGYGSGFARLLDDELLELVFSTLRHTNRFVRETGFQVLAAVSRGDAAPTACRGRIAEQLATGLSDNWSQVRMAASLAARNFLLKYVDERSKPPPEIQRLLVPPLCLNRYYMAEGVRLFNQETWRLLATVVEGPRLVSDNIEQVVKFYVEQSRANNHAVREAACACIAELGYKVDPAVVQPHVPQLYSALLVCFDDDSWPVRDAACIACGRFATAHPAETAGMLDRLLPLFTANLRDSVPSVRQGAAASLRCLVASLLPSNPGLGDALLSELSAGLSQPASQPESSSAASGLASEPALFGVAAAKRIRDNDEALHTDRTMYSCGSLAPKMSPGGGCSNHNFRRPAEPWEIADGCVHLLAELCDLPELRPRLADLLPLLAKATTYRQFAHHFALLESVLRRLPQVASGLGKPVFKRHLEAFLEPVAYALEHRQDSQLAAAAAEDCLAGLARLLGPGILRGRIEQTRDPRLLDALSPLLPP
ncbi:hypothetical protein BOX15_Mlig006541g1, partial [Macrostomum lignano]